MNLHLDPPLEKSDNGGIRRVVEAQHRYLPEFGIELVSDPMEADVEAVHVIGQPQNPEAAFVLHNHGMMWSEYNFPAWAEGVNQRIVESIRQAQAVTSPSKWVTRALTRGVYQPIHTIYHGVDPDEWKPEPGGEHDSYVLWNKARSDEVSNPADLEKLARLMPQQPFVSTIWTDNANVNHVGIVSNEDMKELVQGACLYLCTARETFGIGTLEALACGVPVVGWDYGGQREIILQNETGILVPYGDYAALGEAVRTVLDQRPRFSRRCIEDVHARWLWKDKIAQYAKLYESALAWYSAPRPKVSVIVPSHNLARYLPYTLQSIQSQTMTNFECLIVDDKSEDETPEIAKAIVAVDIRFRYLKTFENLKLSRVRNYGAQKALGKYLVYVDADDLLEPRSLEILSDALDQDRSLHIAYGALDLITEEHTHRKRNRFPGEFNWYHQLAHQNQVPTAAMMRREVVELSGGWRSRQWRAEDAEFWSRVTSLGFQARKVTDETTLLYRIRSDSKGSTEFREYPDHDGNWLANIAWRSANSASEGIDYLRIYGETVPQPHLVPFGAQGKPVTDKFWVVSHQEEPLATIVLEGSANPELTVDTLDSLTGQYENRWEVFVIGDKITGFPHVCFVRDALEIKPHSNNVIHINAGQMFASDWLQKQLNLESSPGILSPSKVLLQYKGRNVASAPFRVHGRTYQGSKGTYQWVEAEDADNLIRRGQWARVQQEYLPPPALADQRKD